MNTRPNVNFYTWYAPYPTDVMELMDGIPRPENDSIFWGDLIISCEKVRVLKKPIEPVTLLRVFSKPEVLSHDQIPNPHFKDTKTWIGAVGNGLMWKNGEHHDAKKSQLFRLRPGKHILFFDARKEVTKITAGECGSKPELDRATESEVADYVLGVAYKGRENPETRMWCFHALQELGCKVFLDEFLLLFPKFHST